MYGDIREVLVPVQWQGSSVNGSKMEMKEKTKTGIKEGCSNVGI